MIQTADGTISRAAKVTQWTQAVRLGTVLHQARNRQVPYDAVPCFDFVRGALSLSRVRIGREWRRRRVTRTRVSECQRPREGRNLRGRVREVCVDP